MSYLRAGRRDNVGTSAITSVPVFGAGYRGFGVYGGCYR